jgi:predicted SAM-dependent methyltransferase
VTLRDKLVRVANSSPATRKAALQVRRGVRAVTGRQPTRAARIKALEAAIRALEEDEGRRLRDIEHHLPILLNTISSNNGILRRFTRSVRAIETRESDLARSMADLWGRMETIRRELMFEVRYGDRARTAEVTSEPKVLDEPKVAAARAEGLRVNLGCGHLPLDGYINVDLREMPGVDVLAPVDQLPFNEGEIDELYSAHLVEHFPQEQFVRDVLPYWVSLIRPGGSFRAVLPDAGAMLSGFADGSVRYEDLREVLFGGQEYEGDFHFNMYTTESLSGILSDAGLLEVKVEAEGRPNGACLEMQLSARRPGDR